MSGYLIFASGVAVSATVRGNVRFGCEVRVI